MPFTYLPHVSRLSLRFSGNLVGISIINKDCHVDCHNHPLRRPPKKENVCLAEDKKRAIGERNEVEASFETSKRFYSVNGI